MTVGMEDISRLSLELITAFKDAETWSEYAGIDWEAMKNTIFAIVEGVKESMEEQIKNQVSEERTIEMDDQIIEVGMVDIGQVVASALMQSFVLGWETRNQYGKQDD